MIRRLKRRLSRSTSSPDRAGPHNWDGDVGQVLSSAGKNFSVKYLGSKDVERARGIEVCEQVVESFHPPTSKGKKKMILVIGLDGIRVLEQQTKALIFDQPIEKIAFCAPDRFYDRCFSYIARDAAAQKWICHSFVTILPVTGERISHAVGAAFSECLKRKQRQDRLRQLQNQVAAANASKEPTERTSTPASSIQASIPAQHLQDLYATVHKPSNVPPINENRPQNIAAPGEHSDLLQTPSASIPATLYVTPPQPNLPTAQNADPWAVVDDAPTHTSDPWIVQPPPQQNRRQRRDSAADQWLKRAIREASSQSPAVTPTGPSRDPFAPIQREPDPFFPMAATTRKIPPSLSGEFEDEWASLANRHHQTFT